MVPETRQSLSETPLNLLNQCNVTFETRGPYHTVIFEQRSYIRDKGRIQQLHILGDKIPVNHVSPLMFFVSSKDVAMATN